MRIGLTPICIGSGAQPPVLRAVATSAEAAGFASLWACEHVVLVDRPASRYPYTADGQMPFPSDLDWLDPLITLSVAAAVTHTIRLATGMLLLPEHNPVHVAKQAASLDRLSRGRGGPARHGPPHRARYRHPGHRARRRCARRFRRRAPSPKAYSPAWSCPRQRAARSPLVTR